jgi:hypothetical protein
MSHTGRSTALHSMPGSVPLRTDTSKVLFVIRKRGNPAPCGYIQITNIHPIHRSAEIGIRIGSDEDRGRGIGKAALKLAVDYIWNHLNLNRIQLTVLATNLRAIRAYKAVGFEEEGLFRRAAFINGVWTDVLAMATLRPPPNPPDQWAKRRSDQTRDRCLLTLESKRVWRASDATSLSGCERNRRTTHEQFRQHRGTVSRSRRTSQSRAPRRRRCSL